MNGKQKQAGFEAGFTLIEMLVVVGIIAIMVSLVMPAGSSMIQSHRKSSAQNLIKTSLAQAQAYAAKERKYAGIRFQLAGGGRQYLILVEAKRVVITDGNSYGAWNFYDLMDLYVPVDNVQPTAMPTGTVVLNASELDFDIDANTEVEDWELEGATTFCVIFSPSGQLVKKPAQCGPRVDPTVTQLEYLAYANLDDKIFVGTEIMPPREGLPLSGDLICLNNSPRPVKYSQTGLLLFQLKELEEMDPVERYDYIMDSLVSKALMINVYTGKLIEQE